MPNAIFHPQRIVSGTTPAPPPAQSITLTALAGLSATAGGSSLGFSAQVTNPVSLPLSFVTETTSGPAPTGGSSSWDTGDLNKAISLAWAAAGTSVIRVRDANNALSNSLSVTVAAAPTPSPSPPPSAPTGNITQYLTSDGGSALSGVNFSGPTRDRWHNRLGLTWARTNTAGNWLDSALAQEGSTAYASSAAITAVDQVCTITATALVSRWLANGQNKGFYLRNRASLSLFPVSFYGRTDATSGNRPKLTVVTSSGTFVLTAKANAWWSASSAFGTGSALEWQLAATASFAILRFDLSTVTGTIVSASLSVKVKAFPSGGSTGQIVDLFEADPPPITDPITVASPVLGLQAGYADFNAYKASGNAAILLADDFETGGPFDAGFTPSATRTLNTTTNTTYARGQISSGAQESCDINKSVSTGTGAGGAPNVVRDELFGQYDLYLESNFGTTQEDAIKVPAMGVQFGYWNPNSGGYWQQTTGNGGNVGTGLKKAAFTPANAAGNFEYEGHSVRLITGTEPTALDDDPYSGWFGLSVYAYNLDQVGVNPGVEWCPGIAIRKEAWYTVSIRVKQNSMSGSQDGLGNYATANADGIYQVWLNGLQVYSKSTFRWRRHAEFGVQGLWLDVYHGGTTSAPRDMNYRLDRVSIATSYIGPQPAQLPTWVPATNTAVSYSSGGSVLTNKFVSQVAPYYEVFYFPKVANDYSSGVAAPNIGDYGAELFFGGGHAGTNDNTMVGLIFGLNSMEFRRLANPAPYFGTGTDSGPGSTRQNNSLADLSAIVDATYGDFDTGDGQKRPSSPHSYGGLTYRPPTPSGTTYGSLFLAATTAGPAYNGNNFDGSHILDLNSLTDPTANTWRRAGAGLNRTTTGLPIVAVYDEASDKVHLVSRSASAARTFSHSAQTWTAAATDGLTLTSLVSADPDSGTLINCPERNLVVLFRRTPSNTLECAYQSTSGGVLGAVGIATLSATLTVGASAGSSNTWANMGFWISATQRIMLGKIQLAGVADTGALYEVQIPATLTDPWTVTRRPFTGTVAWPSIHHQRLAWFERIKCAVLFYNAQRDDQGADTVQVIRPFGV